MKIRELSYRLVSEDFLNRRIAKLSKELDKSKTSSERKKILDEADDIFRALMYKHRDDINYLRAIRDGLNELINKYKPLNKEG